MSNSDKIYLKIILSLLEKTENLDSNLLKADLINRSFIQARIISFNFLNNYISKITDDKGLEQWNYMKKYGGFNIDAAKEYIKNLLDN